jgi:hypothetical protein
MATKSPDVITSTFKFTVVFIGLFFLAAITLAKKEIVRQYHRQRIIRNLAQLVNLREHLKIEGNKMNPAVNKNVP